MGEVIRRKEADSFPQVNIVEPERYILYLPSDFTSSERICYGLELITSEEVRLREGEAHDALRALRGSIKAVNIAQNQKSQNSRGQKLTPGPMR
jgi:hypothetical protein